MKLLSRMTCLMIFLGFVLIPFVSQGEEFIPAVNTLLKEAREASARGAFQEALNKVEKAQTLSENMDDTSGQSHPVWDVFVDVIIELKQDEKNVLELRSQILTLIEHIGVQDGAAETIINDIGATYEKEGQYDLALQCYQRAWDIQILLEDENADLYGMQRIGTLYEKQRQYDKALQFYKQQRMKHKETGNTEMEIRALHKIVYVYHQFPQYEKALEIEQAILAIQKMREIPGDIGMTLRRIGYLYNFLGHYEKALDFHRQALNFYKKLEGVQGDRETAGVLETMGYIYRNLGLHDKAITLQEQAIELWSKTEATEHVLPYSLIQLARSHQMRKQYEQALEILQHALEIAQKKTERDLQPLKKALAKLPKGADAEKKQLEEQFTFQKSLAKNTEAFVMDAIGTLYNTWGQYEKSLEWYQKAIAIFREFQSSEAPGLRLSEGMTLERIGTVYVNMEQYENALEFYHQALAIYRELEKQAVSSLEAQALEHIGRVYEYLEQYDKAIGLYRQTLELTRKIGMPNDIWPISQTTARSLAQLEKYPEALELYEEALDTIESLRAGLTEKEYKLGFMRDKLTVYDELIDLLYMLHTQNPDKGYDRKALEIFERKQGRIFLEEMGESGARIFTGLPEAIVQRERDLELLLERIRRHIADERVKPAAGQDKALIQTLEEQAQTILAEQETLQERIKTRYPDYYALKYPKPVTLAELQQQVLQSGELMLIYNVMQNNTSLWLIGKERFGMYSIELGRDDLKKHVRALRGVLYEDWGTERGLNLSKKTAKKPTTSEEQQSFAQVSHALYTILLPEAARPLLAEGKTLNIIPTGPLYSLPFELLLTHPSHNIQDAHYFIEDIPISYLSSASLLKTLREVQVRRSETAQYPLLAFAHPAYQGESSQETDSIRAMRGQFYRSFVGGNFVELPETADEAREIATILNTPEESESLQLREHASRGNVVGLNAHERLDDYQYLLFAMHGILPGEVTHVNQSALVLSDDFLTMADVFGLQLNAKLVSLSACNTGRGTQVKGEGITGLTRAFMYAGTPAVAVTLWSVESLSAKELDIGFFRHLHDGVPPAKALQSIKIRMLRGEIDETYRLPYYWAPFVIFGDGMNK